MPIPGAARRWIDPQTRDYVVERGGPRNDPTRASKVYLLGRNYLACDATTSLCAATEAPVAPTEACSASFEGLSDPVFGSAYGVVLDASCTTGTCRFSAGTDCDRHICALPCSDDWDCPATHRCEPFPNWTGRTVSEGPTGGLSVCREMTDADLVCR